MSFSFALRSVVPLIGCVVALVLASPTRAFTVTEGYIVVSSGAPVYQSDLDQWILLAMPASTQRLLMFTQCFGGNFVEQFNFSANTAAASAQEAGKVAYYGGYHWGAGLKFGPGLGRTGQTPHDGGIATRNPLETPQSGGLLPLTSFSFSDNNNSALIRKHRRVIVHAGIPDPYWDDQDASHILNNFVSQPLTTVETIGKNGGAGIWDFAGTAKSLHDRIVQAGIALASTPPGSFTQFLLFVTDHGGLANVSKPDFLVPLPPQSSATQLVSPFSPHALATEALLQDPNNQPGLAVVIGLKPPGPPVRTVSYDALGNGTYLPLFAVGDWTTTISIDTPFGPVSVFSSSSFSETYVDLDGDGALTGPGEGIQIFFPIPEATFLGPDLFDLPQDMAVRIANATSDEFQLVSVALVTGDVRKVAPEPTGALPIGGLVLVALARRKAHRKTIGEARA